MVFELASDRLSTNLSWPLRVYDFPQNASGKPNCLRIDPIGARETVTLNWHWHFLSEASNEAQGDSFSFTINYKLEKAPLPPLIPWIVGIVGGVLVIAAVIYLAIKRRKR